LFYLGLCCVVGGERKEFNGGATILGSGGAAVTICGGGGAAVTSCGGGGAAVTSCSGGGADRGGGGV
jgi:hypothetical protein